MAKKRNPQDMTMRNMRAVHKALLELCKVLEIAPPPQLRRLTRLLREKSK
jgi:hypothetical protein